MRTALRLIPLMVIGGLAAFLLVGPLSQLYRTRTVGSRPLYSPSQATAGPSVTPGPSTCPSSAAMPTAAPPVPTALVVALPGPVWVNDPLGVNLRSAASASAARLTTLSQGTRATADGQLVDASGDRWYHVSVGTQTGWVRAAFVVSAPIHPVVGDGWSLMLPDRYDLPGGPSPMSTRTTFEEPVSFLTVASAPLATGLDAPQPSPMRTDAPWLDQHSKPVQVWNYTVLEHTGRAPIDSCQLPIAARRPDGGWPFGTSVTVTSSTHVVEFLFLSGIPDDPLVDQVLASVALS